ncbi:E3 ubiquitin-protein ligase [Tetrabaena socialis]|uniref:E3 ubiquitin-protein ligase n=1 Tax=Tetrabaena socialis TaxID=47790 RepID=A0A2J8A4L2_9CHLO|nr:E3 ubiquitin-protein ligase [Tetrabaena socialis]|eukprot:PNH07448.1 E3 ubiquitin-protein ligase [Tetrabaena socialis]
MGIEHIDTFAGPRRVGLLAFLAAAGRGRHPSPGASYSPRAVQVDVTQALRRGGAVWHGGLAHRAQGARGPDELSPDATALLEPSEHQLSPHEPLDDESACIACMASVRSTILIPCGHMVLCAACAAHVMGHSGVCPMCRTHVSSHVTVS